MCGILGYIGYCEEQQFKKALDKLSHRGPDGWGVMNHGDILLGHRRLSIIDLSDNGKQPMELYDRYSITFNGEIYNYIEIKEQLTGKGIIFKSESDTEVLLQAFIEWGTSCFEKFNGMWALAIWDKIDKTLILSRDRLGKKPLFYHQTNNQFIFSSEMKGIYPFLSHVEIDHKNVENAISNIFGYESTEKCLIKGLIRFPAASYGIYNNKQLKVYNYWNPLNHIVNVSSDYNQQVEYFRELFLDACAIRMRSDVTIGTALSGGLDSSAVICSMAYLENNKQKHIQKDWQHAFVASFPNTSIDETHYAKIVSDHLKIKTDFIKIDPVTELNDIYHQAYLFEELYYAPTIPFVQLYRKIKQGGITVSIDGHGADELFAGYPFDIAFGLPDTLPNLLKFKRVLNTLNQASSLSNNEDWFNKLKFALLNKYSILNHFSKHKNNIIKHPDLDFLNSKLLESTLKTVLPTLLRNYDRYSMINGVEIRMPFLDHRIVEFAFSIPYSSKVKNGYGKSIVRDAMHNIVPERVIYRKNKIGFNSPMDSWLKGSMKEWVIELVNSENFKQSSLINGMQIRKEILNTIEQDKISYKEGEKTFAKIMPFIWEKSLSYAHV